MRTPWGASDSVEQIAEGIQRIGTPSHGGFKLDKARNDMIPLVWRRAGFNDLPLAGWYEEDCDWCMVALIFPQYFPQAQVLQAAATFQHYAAKRLVAKDTP